MRAVVESIVPHRRKFGAWFFVFVLIAVSTIGVAVTVLAEWQPVNTNPWQGISFSPTVGGGGVQTETVDPSTHEQEAILSDGGSEYDLGQTISFSGTIWYCTSISGTAVAYYNGGVALSKTVTCNVVSWGFTETPGTTGTESWYITLSNANTGLQGTSGTASITVNSALSSVSISDSVSSADQGQTITFTSSSVSGGSTPYSYQWYDAGSAVSGATGTTWSPSSYPVNGPQNVYLVVTDNAGSVATSNTLSITISSDPNVSASSSLDPADAGQTVTFSSSVSGGSGGGSYTWYSGSTSDQIGTGSSYSTSFSSGTYSIFVVYVDSNGYSVTSNTITQIVYPDPQAAIINAMTPGVFYVYSYTSGPTEGAVPYSDINSYPLSMPDSFPNNVSTWTGTFNDGGFGFDYGNPGYNGQSFLGRPNVAYPSSLGVLNTEPSGGAYDEGYMAVTVLYFAAGTYTFNGEYDDNGAMFISNNGVDWTSIIGSSAWVSQGATAYSGTETLSAGWYFFAVDNGNLGGGPSMSALNITGGSISVSGTPPIVSTTDAAVPQFFLTAVMGGTGTGYTYSLTGTGSTYTTPAFNTTLAAGSYTEDLSVTDGAGETATATTSETVHSDPIVSASSSVSSADVGYSITFSSSPSGGTAPYAYSWIINGTQVSTSQDFSYSFTSAGTYTVEVTVTDSIGETYSSSVSVTINNNPSVSISSSQNPTDAGNAVTFTASESGGTGTMSYAWTVNGVSEGSGSTLDYTFASSGTYYVNATVTDADGHTASYSYTETVYSDPAVSISSSQNPTDTGNAVTFTASPSGGSGTYTYQWYEGSSAISGATSSTYATSFSSSGTYSFYVVVKDSVGNSVQSSTLDETVNADPAVSISSSQNPTDVGNAVTFTASGSGGTGSYSYQWYLNGAAVSGATSSTYVTSFSSPGTESVYVILTDGIGNTAQSPTLDETVNADPAVSISSSQNPADVGNAVTFTASASGGTGAFSYVWYLNSAVQSATTNEYSTSFSSPGTYIINVSVKDSLGNVATYSFSETVNADPAVTVASSPNPTDVGVAVQFSSSPTGGTTPYNYTWEINSIIVSYASSFTYTFGSSGAYSIQLTVRDANGNTAVASLTETVNADPAVSISPEYTSVDQGTNDTFTANVNGGTYPFNYTWTVNGVIVNYSQSFHYAFSSVATYTVGVTVKDSLGESNSYSISVSSIQKPSVSINGANNTDTGVSAIFVGNATYGTAPYVFNWTVNGVTEGSGLSLTYTFTSAGTYTVALSATDSQNAKATASFTVRVHNPPVVSISSQKLVGDTGLTDSFSSTVTHGSAPYIYRWYVGSNEVGSQQNLTFTFNSVGTILVRLVVTDSAGVQALAETNVTINGLPVVSISAKYRYVDAGIVDTLNASGTYGTLPYSYAWYVNGVSAGSGPSLQYTFSLAGSYTVKVVLTDVDGNSAGSSITIQAFGNPQPTILANRTSIDTGMYVGFFSGISGGTGPYNYTWTVNGGVLGYGSTASYDFLSLGTYNITLTVRDAFGIKGNVSLTITVNPLPTITASASILKLDEGQSVLFLSTVSGGTGPYTYYWEVNSIIVSSQENFNYTFTASGTYSISVRVTDGLGASASYTLSITVNPGLSATLALKYPTVDENITDSITLTAHNGTAPYTYAILVNGNRVSASSAYSQYFTVPGIYYVTAYVNDSTGESVTLESTIVVRSNPSVSIVTPTNRTDANVPMPFRGILSGGTGPYTYSWLIGGHTYANATLSHAFTAAGDYNVQLTVTDAFGREAISSVSETVFADPHASLVAPSYLRVSIQEPLSLNISGGIQPYFIQWYFPSGEQLSGNNVTHAFSSSGPDTIEARVTDSSGYTDTQNFTVQVHLFVAIAANQTSGLGPLAVQFSSSVLGGSGYSYNWSFSPNHSSLLPNPVYSFPVGNYSVHFTVTSANGATGSKNLSIQSLPPPATFSYSPTANGTILSTFHFTATPNWDATGPYSMSWSFPNGQTLSGMNVSYQFPIYSEFNTVIATFTYGNGKTWTQDITVRLYPAPIQASFSIPRIVPVGAVVNLTGSAVDPDSTSLTYTWVFQNQTFNGQNQFFVFSSAGNYTVSLTVTDSLGATDTYTQKVEAEQVGNNANIVIGVQSSSNGPYTTYTIHVLSSAPLAIVEAFLGTQSFTLNPTSNVNGYWYNITLDQSNYIPGTYPLKIVVFADNGESNYAYASFFVSQAYGHGGQQFSIISFFGGTYTFLLTVISIIIGIGTIVALRTDKKDKDTAYVNIGGAVVKAHKSPLARLGFTRAADRGDVAYLSSPPPSVSPAPPSFNAPTAPDFNGETGNRDWKLPPGGAS